MNTLQSLKLPKPIFSDWQKVNHFEIFLKALPDVRHLVSINWESHLYAYNFFLELRSFEAHGEQTDKKEVEMEDKIQRLQRENEEQDRHVEQINSENASMKKTIEDLENELDRVKREKDEATESLENVMRELSEMS